MNNNNLKISFLVTNTPHEVFTAVNNVKGWWTENLEGSSKNTHDEFEVRFEDIHYSKQKLVEVIPDEKVTWLVTDSKLSFVEDQQEWTNTKIIFEISKQGNKTQLQFTHQGLHPEVACYSACSGAWTDYIRQSLFALITTGKGKPEPRAKSIV